MTETADNAHSVAGSQKVTGSSPVTSTNTITSEFSTLLGAGSYSS
jgi:hypothetical protein